MPSMNITENESLNFYNIRFIFNNALVVGNNDNCFAFFIEFVQ